MQKLLRKSWLFVGACVLGIGIASAAARPPSSGQARRSEQPAQPVCIAEGTGGSPKQQGWHGSTLALAVASTADPGKLIDALDEQLDRAEESANPLSLHLDESDPSDLEGLTRELWPRVTAAQALLRPKLESGAQLVACNDPAARYGLWQGSSSGLPVAPPALRQRAWARASLAVLQTSDAGALAARLRKLAAASTSTIALVIAPSAALDGLGRLGERARQLERRARRSAGRAPPLLGLLAQSRPSIEQPIVLQAGELVVVPRLGALARLPDFAGEIERALTSGDGFKKRPEFIGSVRSGIEQGE